MKHVTDVPLDTVVAFHSINFSALGEKIEVTINRRRADRWEDALDLLVDHLGRHGLDRQFDRPEDGLALFGVTSIGWHLIENDYQ